MRALTSDSHFSKRGAHLFRAALFAAAASLAIFILYKLATKLHATEGLYAVMFPWSALLAIAGMTFAIKPRMSCDCSVPMRSGLGAVAAMWLTTGAMCGPSIVEMAWSSPMHALYVGSLMTTQHIFLSVVILAFVFAPSWMTQKLSGSETSSGATAFPSISSDLAKVKIRN